jgi:NAD(P)-dependent dehydrogenase (short-subunit alcohol dehydrogenase family)
MQRIALVTGSYKGLGFAIAERLAKDEGMKVILSGRDLAKVQESAARMIKDDLSVDAIELDVDQQSSVESAIATLEQKYGHIDVLVNNAGVNPSYDPTEQSFLTVKTKTLGETINTNATAVLTMMQSVVPLMKKAGYGRIVNVSTEMASLRGIPTDYYPLALSYRVSKIALNGIVSLVAKELAGTDILINAYSPGWLKTDMGGPDAPFTAHEGAETAIYLATLPTGGPSGKFYAEMRKFGGPIELQW